MLRNNGRHNFRSPLLNIRFLFDRLITEDSFNLVQEDGSFILV
jgi:hypothetical protein